MKRIVIFAALAVLAVGSLNAQNKFKGIVTYTLTSVGEMPYQVPAEMATAEVMVYEDKAMTSHSIFTQSPIVDNVLVDGRKTYSCIDLTMIMMYLTQNDVELDYTGSNKLLLKSELTQNDIDSLTIPCTEGFYIEYVDGETKQVAGRTAKKAVFHIFGEDGEDKPMVIWYDGEIGPQNNMIFNGLKGTALEYTMDLGEGRQLQLTATEVKSGKVKAVDLLLPSGYEEISSEEFGKLMKEISEEMKYLQED